MAEINVHTHTHIYKPYFDMLEAQMAAYIGWHVPKNAYNGQTKVESRQKKDFKKAKPLKKGFGK